MVIASGQSTRQINTAAYKLAAMLRAEGLTVLGTEISVEGERDDDWLVVDGGACVYSLFLPDARDEYDLEALWGAGRDSSGEPAAMWHIDDVDEDEQQDDGFEGDEDEVRLPPKERQRETERRSRASAAAVSSMHQCAVPRVLCRGSCCCGRPAEFDRLGAQMGDGLLFDGDDEGPATSRRP
jgi:ribosomal silencing factor RsfS